MYSVSERRKNCDNYLTIKYESFIKIGIKGNPRFGIEDFKFGVYINFF